VHNVPNDEEEWLLLVMPALSSGSISLLSSQIGKSASASSTTGIGRLAVVTPCDEEGRGCCCW